MYLSYLPGDDPALVRVRTEILRRMTPEQKIRAVHQLNRVARAMAMSEIRVGYPDASDREVFLRFAIRNLGYELARWAYPEIAQLEI